MAQGGRVHLCAGGAGRPRLQGSSACRSGSSPPGWRHRSKSHVARLPDDEVCLLTPYETRNQVQISCRPARGDIPRRILYPGDPIQDGIAHEGMRPIPQMIASVIILTLLCLLILTDGEPNGIDLSQ